MTTTWTKWLTSGFLALFLLVGLGACKSKPTQPETAGMPMGSLENSDLSAVEAVHRKQRVFDVDYELAVRLDERDTKFSGQSKITFQLTDPSADLRLDFFEGEIQTARVNGQPMPTDAKKKFWIQLPSSLLKPGQNTVEIAYTQEYSTKGQGLHRFVDPETKQTFLYSQFETFDANRFMPCFDQPDLKASLALTVDAPAKWEVITTTSELSTTKTADKRKIWKFEKTPKLSTYLFSLHAGPYRVWKDKFENIPLRLFARPSMAKYVRSQEWFLITKQGLRFFNNFFAFPYPFRKYDQLIVPEFNAGAMENVGAVTFSERFLQRSEVTRQQKRRTASVILHEMAHMWFGDIVTMKWWNDLWLNESFATAMAAIAMHEGTEFKESWQDFFADDKTWAYWEDSLVTTHPIEGNVQTVKQAFATFDGITYGKGASVIKQLRAYMSPAAFKKGVQDYMASFAYKNAELKDFITTLQKYTDRDLNRWSDRWLKQSGTDKIAAKWSCEDGTLKTVDLTVTPSPGADFRPQAIRLGMFQDKGSGIKEVASVDVELKGTSTTVKGNWSCPDFLYPNYEDDGYIQVTMDDQSLNYLRKNLSRINDKLLRTMLWHGVWNMVRDTELPLKDYVALVEKHFAPEHDEIILDQIVETIAGKRGDRGTVLYYWPTTDTAKAERDQFIQKMEDQFMQRFKSARAGSDPQKFWFDAYVRIARTDQALNQLAKWFDQAKVGPGFPLDLDRKWNLVRQLARYQYKEAPRLLESLKKKDLSDRGLRNAMATEAIQPDADVKQKWLTMLKATKPELSFEQARSVMWSLFPAEQGGLAARFADDFYGYLKTNGASENENFVRSFAGSATPLNCDEETSTRLKDFVKESDKFSPTVVKTLKVTLEEDERCQRVRKLAH
ncbi:MAG: aminopeptidase N [Bdellovibrionales bacterium]